VHAHAEPLCLLEHRLEAAGAFRARYLDPVLRAVREALRGVGERVQVTGRQAERPEELARRRHHASLVRRLSHSPGSASSPARRLVRTGSADSEICSSCACAPFPSAPRPSSTGTPSAPTRLPSEPPP